MNSSEKCKGGQKVGGLRTKSGKKWALTVPRLETLHLTNLSVVAQKQQSAADSCKLMQALVHIAPLCRARAQSKQERTPVKTASVRLGCNSSLLTTRENSESASTSPKVDQGLIWSTFNARGKFHFWLTWLLQIRGSTNQPMISRGTIIRSRA